jgi:DNA-binding CsgD family transcriptional regulator
MKLTNEDHELVAGKLLDLGMCGLFMDSLFASLCSDVLASAFCTGGAVYVLEEDLSIRTICHFGLTPIESTASLTPHLFQNNPLTRAMKGEMSVVTGKQAVLPGAENSPYAIFIPLPWRGFPYAVAVFTVSKPLEISDSQELWGLLASGLTLLIIREERAHLVQVARNEADEISLSTRQIQILGLVAAGQTNNEIAKQLFIGNSTVGHELLSVSRLLGVNSRSAAVQEAGRRGILARD